ncbi:MAG: Ribonuclease D [Anaerolineales bacterium]|nr:Ribonuclease D [Anaerolineales bacterium]
MLERLPPPVWVATRPALEALVNDLAHQPRLAVDTESNSLHAYREQVCLIQFSTPQKDYLVDPLALNDLAALTPIFANPRIEKVFHAAEYDLICLRRDFGFNFANIFDTMHAERILGCEKVGLDAALEKYFNVTVNKRLQKADWGARPLTRDQMEYARLDTHYLILLRGQLQRELELASRWDLAREDFARACRVNGTAPASPEPWERFAGRRDLTLRQLTVLRELAATREEIALRLDRPPFKVIVDEKLLVMARRVPATLGDLEKINLSPRQIQRWGAEFLAAAARGAELETVRRPPPARPPDEAALKRLDKLKAWRKKTAQQMKVESDVVLPRPYLLSLAERGADDLQHIMQDSPARLERFGAEIRNILGG